VKNWNNINNRKEKSQNLWYWIRVPSNFCHSLEAVKHYLYKEPKTFTLYNSVVYIYCSRKEILDIFISVLCYFINIISVMMHYFTHVWQTYSFQKFTLWEVESGWGMYTCMWLTFYFFVNNGKHLYPFLFSALLLPTKPTDGVQCYVICNISTVSLTIEGQTKSEQCSVCTQYHNLSSPNNIRVVKSGMMRWTQM
jgi:hypothetical protein